MKKIQINCFVATVVILLAFDVVFTTTLFAGGDKYSPRLVGMGRAFTAFSRGLDAVGVNPANLALNDRDATVTINIVPIGFSIGSDMINLQIYNDFFTGVDDGAGNRVPKFLTDEDKDKILELFPSGIANTQLRLETAPIGVSLQFGDFGLAIVPSVQTALNLDLDKAYLEFPLRGYPAGKSYNFDNTAINGQSVFEVNFSVGYLLPLELPFTSDIAVGIGVKYLNGLAFIATDHYNASIVPEVINNPDGSQSNGATVANFDFLQWAAVVDEKNPTQPAGTGLGFDVGVSMRLLEDIQFAVSVTDIGKISWDKNTKAIIGNASLRLESVGDTANQNKLKEAFKGKTVDTTGFEFALPTAVNVGAAIQMDDMFDVIPFRWLVAVDGHFGLNEIGGNTKLPQFSIGTELDPLAGWLPLRTGITIGGRERFAWSAGFGLHFANTFDLDFATQSIALLTNPETFRTGSFTMGMRLRF
ncbi:MAG: DUF5723 family protein [Bacteroidota bacterium]|nr:DUF5723 family protein [Bacteroidota bacterium]